MNDSQPSTPPTEQTQFADPLDQRSIITKLPNGGMIIDTRLARTPIKRKPKLGHVSTFYHQPESGNAKAVETRIAHELESDEQPYQRIIKLGEERKLVDTGWLEGKVSMILIQNNGGERNQGVPSEDQKREALTKCVEIWFCPKEAKMFEAFGLLIHTIKPKDSFHISPPEGSTVSIRCTNGTVKVTITAFPL